MIMHPQFVWNRPDAGDEQSAASADQTTAYVTTSGYPQLTQAFQYGLLSHV